MTPNTVFICKIGTCRVLTLKIFIAKISIFNVLTLFTNINFKHQRLKRTTFLIVLLVFYLVHPYIRTVFNKILSMF